MENEHVSRIFNCINKNLYRVFLQFDSSSIRIERKMHAACLCVSKNYFYRRIKKMEKVLSQKFSRRCCAGEAGHL
jgi:hypothetical protein